MMRPPVGSLKKKHKSNLLTVPLPKKKANRPASSSNTGNLFSLNKRPFDREAFGFGASAPRFNAPRSLDSLFIVGDGYSQYSTFHAPSPVAAPTPVIPPRRGDAAVNEHNYSGAVVKQKEQAAPPPPQFLTLMKTKIVAKGTGSQERFLRVESVGPGPGEYAPELVLGDQRQVDAASASSNSPPPPPSLVAFSSPFANRPQSSCSVLTSQSHRTASTGRPSTATRDMWRLTFAGAGALKEAGGSPFVRAGDTVVDRCSFMKQKLTKNGELAMKCSAVEERQWGFRPVSYVRDLPQVKHSFNIRIQPPLKTTAAIGVLPLAAGGTLVDGGRNDGGSGGGDKLKSTVLSRVAALRPNSAVLPGETKSISR